MWLTQICPLTNLESQEENSSPFAIKFNSSGVLYTSYYTTSNQKHSINHSNKYKVKIFRLSSKYCTSNPTKAKPPTLIVVTFNKIKPLHNLISKSPNDMENLDFTKTLPPNPPNPPNLSLCH